MIITKILNFNSSRYSEKEADITEVDKDLDRIYACLQGRVRFGPGTSGNDGENIFGQWVQITTNSTKDTETIFTHSCGSVPIGYLVVWQDKAGSLYQGPSTGTVWTNTTISLKCSVASVTAKLFLLK